MTGKRKARKTEKVGKKGSREYPSFFGERKKRKPIDLSGVTFKPPSSAGPFLPDYPQLVRMIALQGYNDAQIAHMYGATEDTIAAWRKLYPDFDKAVEAGRTHADAEVQVALYRRAIGYDYSEEKAVGGREPQVLEVKCHAPPDVDAIKFWMTNRKRELWSTRSGFEVTGKNGGPIDIKKESKADVIAAILSMIKPPVDDTPAKK